MSVLTRLKPSQWPGLHSHTCSGPKGKRHRWRHFNFSGYCSFKAHALCGTHRRLFNKAWNYPNPSQKAAQIASEEREKAEQEWNEQLAGYLLAEGPGNEPNQLIKFLVKEAEKQEDQNNEQLH